MTPTIIISKSSQCSLNIFSYLKTCTYDIFVISLQPRIANNQNKVKWREFIRLATERGYRLQSHGKKHDIYINDQGDRLVVERHGSQEIRPGLMKALLKQLGL